MDPDWSPLRAPPGSPLPWVHVINGPLATEWLNALTELVSDRALARHDAETWIFQRGATVSAWSAAGWFYKSLNLCPAADAPYWDLRHAYFGADSYAGEDSHADGAMFLAAQRFLRAAGVAGGTIANVFDRATLDCSAVLTLHCPDPPGECPWDRTLAADGSPCAGSLSGDVSLRPLAPYTWGCWSYKDLGARTYNVLPALRESFLALRTLVQSWRARGIPRVVADAHTLVATQNAILLSRFGFNSGANNPNLTADLQSIVDGIAAAQSSHDSARKNRYLAELAAVGGAATAVAGAVNPLAGAVVAAAFALAELGNVLLPDGIPHLSRWEICGRPYPSPIPLYLDQPAGIASRAPSYPLLGPDQMQLVTPQEALASRTEWAKRARPEDALGPSRAEPNAPSVPMSTGAKVALGGVALAGVGGAASLAMGVDPLMWIGQLVAGGRKRRR